MAVKSGRAIPPRLLEPPPEVQSGLELYMKAFFDLAGDRPQGGRIRWSTVEDWCARKGLDGVDAEDVHFLLTRMDIAYMEWSKTKGKKQRADQAARDRVESGGNGIPTTVR